jgi:hypothetical protein
MFEDSYLPDSALVVRDGKDLTLVSSFSFPSEYLADLAENALLVTLEKLREQYGIDVALMVVGGDHEQES